MTLDPGHDPPRVCLLGQVTVLGPAGPQPVGGKLGRAVLVHLTLAEGRALSVDLMIDALWPDDPPARAHNALQVKISRLRALLGDQAHRLTYSQGAYRLVLDPEDSDVGRFVACIGRGEAALRDQDHARALVEFAAALGAWRGAPLTEFGHDPRVAAAQLRLGELHATAQEGHAEARLPDRVTRSTAIADLRDILEREPLRPRARQALMQGLELSGRRPEALAVYDAGRRLFLQRFGLEPPSELRAAFELLLEAERHATRRADLLQRTPRAAPDGLLAASRWLADDGDLEGGIQLAVRGAWWWWTGGSRGPARELLEDLLERSEDTGAVAGAAQLSARAWLGVFRSVTAQAAVNLDSSERTLRAPGRAAWSRHDALAAVLVAERLYERGEHSRGGRLLRLATRHYGVAGDEWGQVLCGTVAARGRLLAGDVPGAQAATYARLAEFAELGDHPGQIMALDILGYCAEVLGDLARAHTLHRQALDLARRSESPDWEAAQLTRLGNVGALAGTANAIDDLTAARRLSTEIRSETITALSRNGLGVALHLRGDAAGAAAEHLAAWSYYTEAQSLAGLAYTGARLAVVHATDRDAAAGWAVESLHQAVPTRDPRALAHSLEAFALVVEDPTDAIRALGAAASLREASTAPLPARQQRPVGVRRRDLAREMGAAFMPLWREGAAEPARTAAAW